MVRLSLAILVLHCLAVFQHFPLRHASADDPLASGDLSFYLGSGLDAAKSGRLFGYSPSYMAGYPQGLWMSLGRKGYESAMLIPIGPPASRFYVFVVGMALTTPLVLGLAIPGGWRMKVQAAAFAAVIYQLCDPLTYFWTFGNVAFPFACSLAVMAAAMLTKPTLRRAAIAGLIGALAIWIHTLAAVPLAFALLSVALAAHRGGLRLTKIIIALILSIAMIATIIVPSHWYYLSWLDQRVPMRIQPLPSGVRYFFMDVFNDRAYRHPLDRRVLLHLLLVLATWQGICEWRSRQILTCGLGLAGLLTLGFGYLAGHLLKEIQPYRFVVSAELLFIVPATLGLRRLVETVRLANPAGKTAFAIIGFVLLPALTGVLTDLPARTAASGLSKCELFASYWVKTHPPRGRVVCESLALGDLLPHLANCEVIGGGISEHAVIPQRWAVLTSEIAFDDPLAKTTPNELMSQCRGLKARILIAQSEALKKLLKETPAKLEATFGDLQTGEDLEIYSLAPEPSPGIWPGRIEASPNRIAIHDAPPGRFVIPYHYLRGFTAANSIAISPAPGKTYEAPFIQIDNPQGTKEIELIFSD